MKKTQSAFYSALGVLLFLGVPPAFADLPASPQPAPAVKHPEPKADPHTGAYRQMMEEAKASAKNGDLAAAEQALGGLNSSEPDTASWHLETAQHLVLMAAELAREGNTEAISDIASRSFQHLAQAGGLAPDAVTRARAKAMAGFIYERFMGDPASALSSYAEAVQLAPDDKALKSRFDQLQAAYANLQAKIAAAQKKRI